MDKEVYAAINLLKSTLQTILTSGIACSYENKITKQELTYNIDGNVETLKAYNDSVPLFTLTFVYDDNKNVISIERS